MATGENPSWRSTRCELTYRIGRRGAALMAFAFVDFILAWSLIDPETKAGTAALPAYRAILDIAPLGVWAALWLGVGLACLVQAFALREDRLAFTLAIAIKVVWAGGFLAAWLFYDAPRAWLGATTWGVVGALVVVIAGWPEPLRKRPSTTRRETT